MRRMDRPPIVADRYAFNVPLETASPGTRGHATHPGRVDHPSPSCREDAVPSSCSPEYCFQDTTARERRLAGASGPTRSATVGSSTMKGTAPRHQPFPGDARDSRIRPCGAWVRGIEEPMRVSPQLCRSRWAWHLLQLRNPQREPRSVHGDRLLPHRIGWRELGRSELRDRRGRRNDRPQHGDRRYQSRPKRQRLGRPFRGRQ